MIESPTEKLIVEQRGHTLLITINTPPANTWDADNLSGLANIVEQCNAERSVYAIVITGQGEKFFSAGADLKLFADGDKGIASSMANNFGSAFETLANFRGVSIAAINGFAMGGGLECALACDIRIVEAQAQLALPEASVGLLPCGGGTQNLAWMVGAQTGDKKQYLELGMLYGQVQANAFPGQFQDSDWFDGVTNRKGFQWWAKRQVYPNTDLQLSIFRSKEIENRAVYGASLRGARRTRVQGDVVVKF